jgi:hypothetical protein
MEFSDSWECTDNEVHHCQMLSFVLFSVKVVEAVCMLQDEWFGGYKSISMSALHELSTYTITLV